MLGRNGASAQHASSPVSVQRHAIARVGGGYPGGYSDGLGEESTTAVAHANVHAAWVRRLELRDLPVAAVLPVRQNLEGLSYGAGGRPREVRKAIIGVRRAGKPAAAGARRVCRHVDGG